MIVRNPAELALALGPDQRLMGLDLGTKTIGIALSDPGLAIAGPLATRRRTKFTDDAAALAALVAEHGVGGI